MNSRGGQRPTDFVQAVFLTEGASLANWSEHGSLCRELALYRYYADAGLRSLIVSYGGESEHEFVQDSPLVRVASNHWHLPPSGYGRAAALLHWQALRSCLVFKTNQVKGGAVAARAAALLRRPLVARCGYLWSQNAEAAVRGGYGTAEESELAHRQEAALFGAASEVVVTTEALAGYVSDRYGLGPNRVHVVPNYVLTDVFRPSRGREIGARRACFVGRLHPEKGPVECVLALAGLGIGLDVVGDGGLAGRLRETAASAGVDITMHGAVPHDQLPSIINGCLLYICSSRLEGHPKSLLEAMACERPVVAMAVPGVTEVIRHGHNGLLTTPTVEGLRAGVRRLINDSALRAELGANARRYVVQNFGLPRVAKMEYEVLVKAAGFSDRE